MISGSAYSRVTTIRQATTAFAVIGWLLILSAVTMAPGIPKIWAPLNLLVVIPGMISEGVLGRAHVVVSLAAVPVLFWLWCRSMTWSTPFVPKRSFGLLTIFIVLSVLSFVADSDYAMRHHGRDYVAGTFIISAGWWCFLIMLALAAQRFPSPRKNLVFHVAMFSWLAWYAIPYLGELP